MTTYLQLIESGSALHMLRDEDLGFLLENTDFSDEDITRMCVSRLTYDNAPQQGPGYELAIRPPNPLLRRETSEHDFGGMPYPENVGLSRDRCLYIAVDYARKQWQDSAEPLAAISELAEKLDVAHLDTTFCLWPMVPLVADGVNEPASWESWKPFLNAYSLSTTKLPKTCNFWEETKAIGCAEACTQWRGLHPSIDAEIRPHLTPSPFLWVVAGAFGKAAGKLGRDPFLFPVLEAALSMLANHLDRGTKQVCDNGTIVEPFVFALLDNIKGSEAETFVSSWFATKCRKGSLWQEYVFMTKNSRGGDTIPM